jgi:hypothetical protein
MTLALRDLQAAFAAHIVAGNRLDFEALVVGDSIPAAARLRVYRHHLFHSLGSALAETFPSVTALVGEAFFRQLARDYSAVTLPVQPVLAEYGADFPGFLASHQSGHDLPYLADVARLDWALNRAFHAVRRPALGITDLQALTVEQLPARRLDLQPGTALIESGYPLDRIWALSQPAAGDGMIDPQAGGVSLLVLRRSDDVAFVLLSPGEAAFVTALARGGTLEEAAALGLATEPVFDLSSSFARLLGFGAFAALRQE